MVVYGVYRRILTEHLLSLHKTEAGAMRRIAYLEKFDSNAPYEHSIRKIAVEA
jgi:hypothetical protein